MVVVPVLKKHTVIQCFDSDADNILIASLDEGSRKKPRLVDLSPYYPSVVSPLIEMHNNDPDFVLFDIGDPDLKRLSWNYSLPMDEAGHYYLPKADGSTEIKEVD